MNPSTPENCLHFQYWSGWHQNHLHPYQARHIDIPDENRAKLFVGLQLENVRGVSFTFILQCNKYIILERTCVYWHICLSIGYASNFGVGAAGNIMHQPICSIQIKVTTSRRLLRLKSITKSWLSYTKRVESYWDWDFVELRIATFEASTKSREI